MLFTLTWSMHQLPPLCHSIASTFLIMIHLMIGQLLINQAYFYNMFLHELWKINTKLGEQIIEKLKL